MSMSNLQRALVEIFDRSQDSTAGHAKLIQKCQTLYKESDPQEFFSDFTKIIRVAMTVFQKNPNIDRSIDFIAKFASNPTANQNLNQSTMDQTVIEPRQTRNKANATTSDQTTTDTTIANKTEITMEEDEEFENEFLTSLIDWLIDTSKANGDVVRYRSCHILAKLMGAISNEQFIDEDLYDRLSDALLERLKDINSRVQVQAIAAIYRLQDPNDRDCRISRVFLFLMTYDPNWMVRYQALSHVAFSKLTLPDIIDRVRDPSANVRRKALLILSEKVLIKFINIEKRLFILNYSLNDDDPAVLETCVKRLLPSWLAFKENDLVKLLKALDVVEATESMELMMDKMYGTHSLDTLCDDFSPLLNEKHVIPMEKLNAESVFYWAWICSVCKGKRASFEVDAEKAEECLDNLLPSLTEFCEYTNQVIKHIEHIESEADGDGEERKDERLHLENLFIIKQLIKMFEYLDFSDVHGKKTLINLCHALFSNKKYVFFFDTVMSVYKLLIPSLQQRINNVTELISDIKDPHLKMAGEEEEAEVVNETVGGEVGEAAEASEHSETVCEPSNSTIVSKMSPRELKLKISEAKYKRYQLKDSFDNLYKEIKNVDANVDLNKLSELRTQIKDVEDEIALMEGYLKGDIKRKNESIHGNTLELVEPVAEADREDTQPMQDPTECIIHCLNIAYCLLKDVSIVQITPQLRSLFDILVIPNIGSVNEDIRVMAVKVMSLILILKLEIAQKYMPLLLEMIQHDMKDVVIAAFQAMINSIMAFSMNRLANLDYTADSSILNNTAPAPAVPIDPQQVAERTAKILAVMTSLLDSEDPEIYTTAVEGFCKLYMTGHIVSAKLLSKLIIMYYSPITENDVKLRACLSCFLPQFSFLRPCNQVCVEETFMLILKSLINAPPDSYLSEIDLTKVMEVMFNLTNPKNLLQRRNNQRVIQHNNICHENIVRSICYEVLKDDNAYKCKTYLKVMNMADLTNADYLALKSIYELGDEVQMHIADKLLKKSALKFNESVMALMSKMPEHLEEQRRKKEEEERGLTASDATANETQALVNGTGVDATQLNSTRMPTSAASSRMSMGGDMIDLDFKKLGRGGKKSNRTLGVTRNEESNVTEVAEETQVAKEDEPFENTVVENTVVEKTVEEDSDEKETEENKDERSEKVMVSPPRVKVTRHCHVSLSRLIAPEAVVVEAIAVSKPTRSKSKNNLQDLVQISAQSESVEATKSKTASKITITKLKTNAVQEPEPVEAEPAPQAANKLTRSKSKNNVNNLMQETAKNMRSRSEVVVTTTEDENSQSESSPHARKQSRKRNVAEKTASNDENEEEEQNLSRTSRSQNRRSKTEYEPPAKVLRHKSTSKSNLKPPEAEKTTRSRSSKGTAEEKQMETPKETRASLKPTRQSTRSSSSK